MPSDGFYIALGLIGGVLTMTGIGMSTSWSPETANNVAGRYMILVGGVLLSVIAVGAFIDLRKRYRDWKIEHDLEDLDRKKAELKLQKKKEEFENTKKKLQKTSDVAKKEEKPNQKQSPYGTNSEDVPPTPTEELRSKRTDPRELKSGEPIIETNKPVPSLLKHESESLKETGQDESKKPMGIETSYTDEDYKIAISMDEHLCCLWALYNAPKNRFATKQDLIIAARGHEGNRTPYYNAINELTDTGLIEISGKTYLEEQKKQRSTGIVDLTQRGLQLIQRARKEKVTSWHDFLEKYKTELQK